MSTEDFELDPERKLWKPSRRTFFFGLGAALVAPMLPNIEPVGWKSTSVIPSDVWMKSVADYYMKELKFVKHVDRLYSEEFLVPGKIIGSTIHVKRPVRWNA